MKKKLVLFSIIIIAISIIILLWKSKPESDDKEYINYGQDENYTNEDWILSKTFIKSIQPFSGSAIYENKNIPFSFSYPEDWKVEVLVSHNKTCQNPNENDCIREYIVRAH